VLNRKRTLKRLATLYGVVVEAELLEMRRRLSLLDEIERAIVTQETAVWKAQEIGRTALKESDLLGWRQARVEAAIVAWNNDQLNAVRDERSSLYEAAKERYSTSRILSEQMDKLLEDTNRRAVEVEERLVQTMSDERYLSRRRWMELHATVPDEEGQPIDE
jgi:hypothetical protein